MKLMIKQRVFSWTDSYDVYDEAGEAKYYVKADFLAIGHQIRVYDKRTGAELGAVHQRLLTFLPAFDIVIGGRQLGTVQKKLSLLKPRYEVAFQGWEVTGNFLGWDYRVDRGGVPLMTISKQLFTWGDTYVLEYNNAANELPGLLLVIAIDAANCSED